MGEIPFVYQNNKRNESITLQSKSSLQIFGKYANMHANTPLGQSERAYYLSYFINKWVTMILYVG